MAASFFTVFIEERPVRFEKNRVISIESYEFGTKIMMEASHEEEEPIVYFTSEPYDQVMRSYLQ